MHLPERSGCRLGGLRIDTEEDGDGDTEEDKLEESTKNMLFKHFGLPLDEKIFRIRSIGPNKYCHRCH